MMCKGKDPKLLHAIPKPGVRHTHIPLPTDHGESKEFSFPLWFPSPSMGRLSDHMC